MKVCLLAESTPSPVLVSALDLAAARHTVVDFDPRTLTGGFATRPVEVRDVDLYLLKSRSAAALAYAEAAQCAGSLVLNTPAGTAAALDRVTMATRLRTAGVPVPRSRTADSLRGLTAAAGPELDRPLVIKSRRSRRGDLVTRVDDLAGLQSLLPEWGDEPVIAQEFLANDGYDLKFWVIDQHLTVARRPAALHERTTAHDVALDPGQLPPEWLSVVVDAGAALDLEIFGVDVLVTDGGPVVIDVNAFPGFRSSANAAHALADLIDRKTAARRRSA
ncbi:MAG: ATP-grasp domain-containing protein [Jatrophihabitantaceae bacterium]